MSASSANSLGNDVLAPGIELIVDRLAYRHHGIYLGEGLVIHYAGRVRRSHGLIETIALRSFVGKRCVRVGRRPAGSRHGEVIVRRARSRLGEHRYAVFSNNCEHFCSWCYVGESRSTQVDRLLQRVRAVRCAVRSIVPRECGSHLKQALRLILSSKSILAKYVVRFSLARSEWALRTILGGGR
jgi:hypothetical protein